MDALVPKNFIIRGNAERYISTVNGPNAQKTAIKRANLIGFLLILLSINQLLLYLFSV
jgi:hypothetical protein